MTTTKTKVMRGDLVVVTKGSERGKTGIIKKVIRVASKKDQGDCRISGIKVIIEGVNRRCRFRKGASSSQGGGAQSVSVECPISISNVQMLDPKTGLPTRVCFRVDSNGVKTRYSVKSGEPLPRPFFESKS